VAVEARDQQLTNLAAQGARRHGADSISGNRGAWCFRSLRARSG
jgi:hypothetical protein